ncbi:acetylornithine aminotransferase [Rhizina undulata]
MTAHRIALRLQPAPTKQLEFIPVSRGQSNSHGSRSAPITTGEIVTSSPGPVSQNLASQENNIDKMAIDLVLNRILLNSLAAGVRPSHSQIRASSAASKLPMDAKEEILANEADLKFASKVKKVVGGEKKFKIISFHNSFLGNGWFFEYHSQPDSNPK